MASAREVDVGDHRTFDRRPAVARPWWTRSLWRREERVDLSPKPFGVRLVPVPGEGGAPDGGASEVGFDPCAVDFEALSLKEVGCIQFPENLFECFPEEELAVAPGERRLYVQNRVPPVEQAHDKEKGVGEDQDPIAEVIRVPKADHLLAADLSRNGLHWSELRTIHI